jgi:NADH:ubiquinone oxidoreductase subunit 5 (subunit L)/multisubunit Na+/H+ antiporter MnhA subunit
MSGQILLIHELTLSTVSTLLVYLGLQIDNLTSIMLIVVTSVSIFLTVIVSYSYKN